MTVATDEATVRQFLEIISAHAVELAKGVAKPGVLQISARSTRSWSRTGFASMTSPAWSGRRSAPPTWG